MLSNLTKISNSETPSVEDFEEKNLDHFVHGLEIQKQKEPVDIYVAFSEANYRDIESHIGQLMYFKDANYKFANREYNGNFRTRFIDTEVLAGFASYEDAVNAIKVISSNADDTEALNSIIEDAAIKYGTCSSSRVHQPYLTPQNWMKALHGLVKLTVSPKGTRIVKVWNNPDIKIVLFSFEINKGVTVPVSINDGTLFPLPDYITKTREKDKRNTIAIREDKQMVLDDIGEFLNETFNFYK